MRRNRLRVLWLDDPNTEVTARSNPRNKPEKKSPMYSQIRSSAGIGLKA